jgi:hypothetical protein
MKNRNEHRVATSEGDACPASATHYSLPATRYFPS